MWKVAGTKVPRSCSANIQFHVCPLCLLFVLTAFNWHDDLSGLQFCSLSSTRNLSAYHCAPKDWQNEWMSMRCEGVRVCVSEWERQRRRVCIREERKRGWDIEWMNIVCVHVNGSREQNRDMEAKWTLNICPPPTDWRGDEIWKSPQLLFFFCLLILINNNHMLTAPVKVWTAVRSQTFVYVLYTCTTVRLLPWQVLDRVDKIFFPLRIQCLGISEQYHYSLYIWSMRILFRSGLLSYQPLLWWRLKQKLNYRECMTMQRLM